MVCDLDHCTFSFTSAVTSAEIRTHRGGCGESHLGSGRSLGWLRSQRLMKKGCSGLRGQATARVLRPHTHQTLGIEREGGKKGGSRLSERAQCPWSAPYPVLSWWIHTSCPGREARPSTRPETPRRSVSRCYGRLLHTICFMLVIYIGKKKRKAD